MYTLKKISINNQTAQFTLLDKTSRRKEKIKVRKGYEKAEDRKKNRENQQHQKLVLRRDLYN